MGLSHQKAHADYGNADPVAQRDFLNHLKNTLFALEPTASIVAFDEFSVCEKPTASYGWAVKNTRPRFVTDGKNTRVNGLLSVALHTGECFFGAVSKADSGAVATYLHQLAAHAHGKGACSLSVVLDQNPTHRQKMRTALLALKPAIPVRFLDVATYSPNLNPVEYLIHLIRLRLLHHAAPSQKLHQVQQRLEQHVHNKVWLSPEQLIKPLARIDQDTP